MKNKCQCGASMLEALVSLFVLSLGVIGAAAMLLTAWRTTQNSGFQTMAVEWSVELAESIRANSAAGAESALRLFKELDYRAERDGEPLRPAKLCYGLKANCSQEELAKFELYELKRKIKTSLPSARVRVCNDAFSWNEEAKAYKWECADLGGAVSPLMIKLGWKARHADDRSETKSDGGILPLLVMTVPRSRI